MSIHDRFESVVDVYVAGGLDPAERREAEEHARACATCGAVLSDAGEFAKWVRGTIAPDAPPADLEDRIVRRLWAGSAVRLGSPQAPAGKRTSPKVVKALRWVAGLAAVVCLVALGGAFTQRRAADEAMVVSQAGPIPGFEHFRVQGGTAALSIDLAGKIDGREGSADALKNAEIRDEMRQVERAEWEEIMKKVSKPTSALETGKAPAAAPSEEPAIVFPEETTPQDRKIIRNANLTVEVETYDAAYAKIGEIVTAEKGFVAGADTQRLANGKMRATVTVRVPPERFEAILAKLRELGTVRNQSITTQDVTKAYVDLQSRLGSKETLAERLRKILAEGKGTMKELMEVEVQLGATIEAIEQIKGEIKYYDNLVGLATIVICIAEKDLGLPFEYVQTLQAVIGLTARDADAAYAQAQKEIRDAGGQVVDTGMVRQNDGSQEGRVVGRVDAEKFPAVREALRRLGHVEQDTVNQQQTGRGGEDGRVRPDAPVKREQATVTVTINTPPGFVTRKSQITVETARAESAYESARKAVEAAGGIPQGALSVDANGVRATVHAEIDADKFEDLAAKLRALGTVKNEGSSRQLPRASATGDAPLIRERAEFDLTIVSPPVLVERGVGATIRNTVGGSVDGLMWSIEKLFVGLSLAGPWLVLAGLVWLFVRRIRARRAAKPIARG